MVSKGVSGVCCGVGMLCGIRVSDRFRGFVMLDGVLYNVAYDVGVCFGSSVFVMHVCHEGRVRVIF